MSSANQESKEELETKVGSVTVASEVATVAATQGPRLFFKLQFANHDVKRTYNFSEANANMVKYQRNVLALPGDSKSWFSLYEIQKVRQAQPKFKANTEMVSMGDMAETIETMESMLRACGYEFVRRDNFNDAVGLNPTRTAEDVGLMVSLLIAENEWETSIMAYRRGDEAFGKAKYLVVPDPVHTPQTKSAPRQMRQMVEDNSDFEDEDMWMKPSRVKKKLDFSTMSNESASPVKPSRAANPVVNTFVQLMQAGHMTMEELARVSNALAGNPGVESSTSQPRSTRSSTNARQRKERVEVEWEDDVEITAQDDSSWNTSGRPITTVLQNLSIRTFDGAKGSADEARAWMSKFLHVANLSGWNARQRLEMFIDSLANPAKYWFQQLPREVKTNWEALQSAFKKKYGTDLMPPRLKYYKLSQKSDELASNYLYRLNAAALRAGIDFRDESNVDNLDDHVQQFFETLHDKNLQMQFRFTAFDSIEELEKKLMQYESTQLRPGKKTQPKKSSDDGAAEPGPAVNRIDHGQRGGGGGASSGARPQSTGEYKPVRPSLPTSSEGQEQSSRPRCEECGKLGHTVDSCWQLMKCEFCHENGHPIKFCRAFIEKMASLHAQTKSGALTAAQVAEQLNV